MKPRCPECERLKHKFSEAAEVSARGASTWRDLPTLLSDGMLTVMSMNVEAQSSALIDYMVHVEQKHRPIKTREPLTQVAERSI